MKAHFDRVGFAIVPLIAALRAACPPEAARHRPLGRDFAGRAGYRAGASDARRAGADREPNWTASIAALVRLARAHRDTPMAGRTFQQHAAPITFGYKVAGWLDEALRHRARLPALKERLFTVQFGGAVGTLATLGDTGPAVRAALARELGLRDPDITWHTARDTWPRRCSGWRLVGGLLGRIGTEVAR
jgi:3-carboxy-cis,cis-muconate cycloisomerase